MENKSRLPKATGLRPPFMTKGSDKIPITSSAVKPLSSEVSSTFRLKRRSKSVTDLRSLRTQFIPKITELKKIPEAVIQKVRFIILCIKIIVKRKLFILMY